jgi:hypothetical protein
MHYPPDIDAAFDAWQANCGPCALAALLDQSVGGIRPYFPGFETRRYTNPTHMQAALGLAGLTYRRLGPQRPAHGLCFVQWGGHAHQPIRAQYRFTHWIAVSGDQVFEVNAPTLVSWDTWVRVMPRIMSEAQRGDGTFTIRTGLSVPRGPKSA